MLGTVFIRFQKDDWFVESNKFIFRFVSDNFPVSYFFPKNLLYGGYWIDQKGDQIGMLKRNWINMQQVGRD